MVAIIIRLLDTQTFPHSKQIYQKESRIKNIKSLTISIKKKSKIDISSHENRNFCNIAINYTRMRNCNGNKQVEEIVNMVVC